jgi:SsrA-binding protein
MKKASQNTIAQNRKARHEFHLEDALEAGIVLLGWEIKALREGKVSITESFVQLHQGEAFLHQAHISPLSQASSHVDPEPLRVRKLLLNRRELDRLAGAVERQGYTLIPTRLYWQRNRVKVALHLAKGKQQHDKREATKARDWQRDKARVLKHA